MFLFLFELIYFVCTGKRSGLSTLKNPVFSISITAVLSLLTAPFQSPQATFFVFNHLILKEPKLEDTKSKYLALTFFCINTPSCAMLPTNPAQASNMSLNCSSAV